MKLTYSCEADCNKQAGKQLFCGHDGCDNRGHVEKDSNSVSEAEAMEDISHTCRGSWADLEPSYHRLLRM